jgi:hypothetical protein
MRMSTAARILIAFGITLSLWPPSACSRVWHVRNDGTGDAPTIQAAIDSSGAGDSILVAPGTYSHGVVFIVSKDGLTVQSEGGANETFIQSVFYLETSTGITIEGFTFEYGGEGIRAYRSTNLILQRNVVRHENGAIVLDWSTDVIIRWNALYSNADGVYCMDLASDVYLYGNTIAHNTDSGFSADDINYTLENNIIAYNKIGVFSTVGTFSCNDVYGNETDYILLYAPDPTGTNGNISMPPLFCGVEPAISGNYYLQKGSPCAPGNNPDNPVCGLIGIYNVGCGYTAVKKTTWGEIKAIFR